jgi:PEP-CTERM motif
MKLLRNTLLLIATGSACFAQLTVSTIAKSSLAVEMSSDPTFQSILANDLYTPQNAPGGSKLMTFSFTSGSLGTLHFDLMGATDPMTVTNPDDISLPGGFIASFIYEVKDDVNNLGADNGAGPQPIFTDYNVDNPASTLTSRWVQNAGGSTSFSFYDRNVTQGGAVWWMNDEDHFLVYQSRELYFGQAMYVLAIEDRADTSLLDYNDGVFLIQHPRTDNPVPEPSTYGLFGAGAIAALVAFRRFRAKKV